MSAVRSEDRRCRIAMVSTRCFPDLGGIEAHVENVVPRIDLREVDLELLATDRLGVLPATETRGAVSVRRFRAYPRSRDYYFSPGLFRAIVRGNYDIVHVQGINALVPPIAMMAAIVSRTKFVLTFHSGGATNPLRARLRGVQFGVLGPLLRRAHALIAVSEFERDYFRRYAGRHGDRIVLIRNGGSDITRPRDVEPDRDLILSVGRLEQYKGHHKAILALPHVLAQRPNARLKILGVGPYEPQLRELVAQLGLQDRVEIGFVPPQDRAELAREMATAGVVVLLSDYEAHPVAVMEALAMGRPVVVRENSGMRELVRRGWVTGVADDADAELTASVLVAAAAAPAPTGADLPTWDQCGEALRDVYASVLTTGQLSAA